MKGSRRLSVQESHLETIERYSLFADLLDSNGIVEDSVLDKLRLNVRSLLNTPQPDVQLLDFCQNVLFHNDMKAFGLHQLILLFIDWQKERIAATTEDTEA